MELRSQPGLRVPRERVAAHRLAGLGSAQFHNVSTGRGSAEVVIEGDNPVHVGARNVERLGNPRQNLRRNVAEAPLDGVQKSQQATRSRGV